MQFEDFDKKVRQAADQHHPNYDEKAWAKMERLLDRHLPRKKDRRRIILFFLLGFLLLGGGVWIAVNKPWQKNEPTLSTLVNSSANQKKQAEPADGSKKQDASPADQQKDKQLQPPQPVVTNDNTDVPATENKLIDKKQNNNSVADLKSNKQDKIQPSSIDKDNQVMIDVTDAGKAKTKKKNDSEQDVAVNTPPAINQSLPDQPVKKETVQEKKYETIQNKLGESKVVEKSEPEKKTDIEKKNDNVADQPKIKEIKTATKKAGNKKKSSLFLSASAGPDISSIGADRFGKVKLLGGAGLGYTFNDRWTVRTGFYTSSKVYTAMPKDYKSPVPIPNPMYLSRIDADCRIYEVPLSLSYNFGRTEKRNMFVSAGISSYFMKKEKYVYMYQYPGGPLYPYYEHEVKDENKHYFSVVTLSGGYQRKISKRISLAAEPYVKLPLSGVGYGKIKLNSAGILVSANISLFEKDNK